MKRIFMCLCVFLGCLAVVTSSASSQNLNGLSEKFYNGLAAVIEDNMDNPVNCVNAVDAYYRNNQALVQQIRSQTAKAMQEIAPMMEKYMEAVDTSMTASDFDEAGLQELDRQMSSQQSRRPPHSPAADRYAKAMEAFSRKYPQYALKIAIRAMELVPEMQIPTYQQ